MRLEADELVAMVYQEYPPDQLVDGDILAAAVELDELLIELEGALPDEELAVVHMAAGRAWLASGDEQRATALLDL